MEQLLTTRELSAHLKVHRATVMRYIEEGMPVHRLPGLLRFRLSEVLAWAAARESAKAKGGDQPSKTEGRADEA